ncbi:MAG: hypothetical protein ABI446_07610 [Gemmatimonadaceae bacterium]
MMKRTIATIARTSVAALLGFVLTTTGLRAQGLSYDVSTSGSDGTSSTGGAPEQMVMTAHGQFSGSNARIDVTKGATAGGFMSAGTYMISNSAKGTSISVNPAKRQYTVINLAALGKSTDQMQASMSGVAKEAITDVKVAVEDLGVGEPIAGYATHKYRLTESSTMSMKAMGMSTATKSSSITDVWVAPALDGSLDPISHPDGGVPTGMTAEQTTQLNAAYAKIGKGLWLKSVYTTTDDDSQDQGATVVTTVISNVKKGAISPSVFVVPAGYKEVSYMNALQANMPADEHGSPE